MLNQIFISFHPKVGTKLKNRIEIIPISNGQANNICVEYHYLHRARTGGRQLSYGILLDNILLGCVVYASPTFHQKRGLIPPLQQNEVIELARLWLSDEMPKHSESCSIGKSLRQLRSDWQKKYGDIPKAVISFADYEVSHEGTIYKAANFYDCGFAPMARFADVGQRYSRTLEGWASGHYAKIENKQSAKRTANSKRIFLYMWEEIEEVTLNILDKGGKNNASFEI